MLKDPDERMLVERRGRRPGQSTTREAILEAARVRFAANGFTGTTIRAIAADARVDAALVMQFFGSKDELFAAVMSISPDALARISTAFEGPVGSIGERLIRAHLAVWEGEGPDAHALRAMLRGAVANERADAELREFIESRLSEDLAKTSTDTADAAVRVALAASMLVGLVVGRQIVQVSVLAEEDAAGIVRRLGPALQAILAPEVGDSAEGRSDR